MKNKAEIIKRIEAITKHEITSNIVLKPNGKNKTCVYYDCVTNKFMKCTISYGFLPSNFRENK